MMSGRAAAIAATASGMVTAAVLVRPASGVLYGRPELASSLETPAFAAAGRAPAEYGYATEMCFICSGAQQDRVGPFARWASS
jgi:hypothetical protein